MKLILLRHAKSDWGDPMQEDRDRPLNKRGRRDAPRIGAWLRARGHLPDRILCSGAARTRETRDRLGIEAETLCLDALYLADPETILKLVDEHAAPALMVIAHNPGIADVADRLTDCDHPDFPRYPTGACTVIETDDGRCLDFAIPRELDID
ncbi:SixA phosphatase family protein [Jannaschia marina]|uniref:SixA phosphatase family protein n=1 Tax=Jannaschia marina TaxID=2741674 RepID=UPI0015CC25F3|nr:histidine phosphatase family protein [Jannaschia marina]